MAYQEATALKSTFDQCEAKSVSFEANWAFVQERFDILRDFCGGIATVPANMATVGHDFLV
jgi:hypothetical protein